MLSLSPTAPVINIRATTIVYLEGAFFSPTILIIKKKNVLVTGRRNIWEGTEVVSNYF